MLFCSQSGKDGVAETQEQQGPQIAVFDFGGEAAPDSLYMRGLCKPSEDVGGLQACQWTADVNTSKTPVPKYFIEF